MNNGTGRPTPAKPLLRLAVASGLLSASVILSDASAAELALSGMETMGRDFMGQPGFSPHLVCLFVTGRNPSSSDATLQEQINWASDPLHSTVADGTGALTIWAHPATNVADYILQCTNLTGIEISHGGNSTLREGLWDRLLTGCADRDRPFLWGFAADDTHSTKPNRIGLSWLAMRIATVDEAHIKSALRNGAFYTSNGPFIADIQVNAATIRLETAAAAEIRWLKSGQYGANSAVVGAEPGEGHCLKQERSVTASSYTLNAADGTLDARAARFVRALVISADGHVAHTMPFRVKAGGVLENPYPTAGRWVRSMTHNHSDVPANENANLFYAYFQAYHDQGIPAAFETGYGYWEEAASLPYPAGRLPLVEWVEPDRAPERQAVQVTIHGRYFQRDAQVQIGGNLAGQVEYVNAGTLRCQVNVPPAGNYDVAVTDPDHLRGTLAAAFAAQTADARNDGWHTHTPVNGGPPGWSATFIAPVPGGGVWAGTPLGVYRWDGAKWTAEPIGDHGLPDEFAYAAVTDASNDTWFSTANGIGRRHIDGRWESWRLGSPPGETITSPDRYGQITLTPDGGVWFASRWSAGLAHFKSGEWERLTTKRGLPSNDVRTLGTDTDGHLWLGDGNGIVRWDGDKAGPRLPQSAALIPGGWVTAMTLAPDGSRWIASCSTDIHRGGVVRMQPNGTNTLYTVENSGLPAPRVWDIHIDARGAAWFATTRGAARLETNGNWTTFTPVNSGIGAALVYGITESKDGSLWFATSRGLSRFLPRSQTTDSGNRKPQ